MSASAIYEGKVTHQRFHPVGHRFSYRLWYLLADLDELDGLDRDLPAFANEKRGIVSFRASDHGPRDGSPLRPWIEERLARADIDLDGGAIRILSFPRVFGYAFNPLSVWFCFDSKAELRAVLYEVSNTFGQSHNYLQPVESGAGRRDDGSQVVRAPFAKELHVSPFIDMDAIYDFSTRVPDERATLVIRETTPEGRVLDATFAGRRLALTQAGLVKMLVKYPFVTVKVIVGIHRQALALFAKGARYRKRPAAPDTDLTVLEPILKRDMAVSRG